MELSKSEKLILFEFLSRNFDDHSNSDFSFADPSEEKILSIILCDLEKTLVQPFDPNYQEIFMAAQYEVMPQEERDAANE